MTDLRALNSATKYPSIPTYHLLGERGSLTEEVIEFSGEEVILTEKVDGTNSRIILMPDGDWFIGSREELLMARGDRVYNDALGIVHTLRPVAERLTGDQGVSDRATVYFLETYGARIGGQAKQYTGAGAVGFRLFDIAFVPFEVLEWEREHIAAWRDNGYQTFANESVLRRAAETEQIELTPRLAEFPVQMLPATVEDTAAWLEKYAPETLVALDSNAGGRAEGIVLRTQDRSVIAKARFEDYARTLRRRNGLKAR